MPLGIRPFFQVWLSADEVCATPDLDARAGTVEDGSSARVDSRRRIENDSRLADYACGILGASQCRRIPGDRHVHMDRARRYVNDHDLPG